LAALRLLDVPVGVRVQLMRKSNSCRWLLVSFITTALNAEKLPADSVLTLGSTSIVSSAGNAERMFVVMKMKIK
jgi:hypothetical protein